MGTVYKATHLTLHVPVALKILHAHVAARPEALCRFRREAHMASRIQHNNVVKVLDFGEEDHLAFLAMEYIQGVSLADWVDSLAAPPPWAAVQDLFLQIVAALEAAHALGVVHRDLKPDNVMLTHDSAGARTVKVVDFGLAHVPFDPDTQSALTRSDQVAGTPCYMSPEQCRSLAVGPPTDIYVLGCILTTLLQLSPPFSQGAPAVTMSQHMYMPVPPLARPPDAPQVPLPLERLRTDMLAKLPERRPRTVSEVRNRFVAAMLPGASESEFPGRKPDLPTGTREERAAVWQGAQMPRAHAETPSSAAPVTVPLVRLGGEHVGGIRQDCLLGLAAQNVRVATAHAGDAALPGERAVVIDAGDGVEDACKTTAEIVGATSQFVVIVCVDRLDTQDMNRLIEAGATDVCRYPVRAEDLARKVRRAMRSRKG